MTYLEYLLENTIIFPNEIKATKAHAIEGKRIAKELGVRFICFWGETGRYLFNDDGETETSFLAKDAEEAKSKLMKKRKEFMAHV